MCVLILLLLIGEKNISDLLENRVLGVRSLYEILMETLPVNNIVLDYTVNDVQMGSDFDLLKKFSIASRGKAVRSFNRNFVCITM